MYTVILGIASSVCTVCIFYLYYSVKTLKRQREFAGHIADAWRAMAQSDVGIPNVYDYPDE